MKKLYYSVVLACFFLTIEKTFSQTFTFVHPDTSGCGLPSSDVECYLGDSIINNTSSTLSIDVVRVENVTTTGWTSAFCLNVCYLPNTDSVRFNLAPNQHQSFIAHFYTSAAPGNDSVLFKVKSGIHDIAFQRFYGSSLCTAGINEASANLMKVNIYPSPIIAGSSFCMNISNRNSKIKMENASLFLTNVLGSKVLKIENLKSGNNILSFDLPAGIYAYTLLSGDNSLCTGKILIEKTTN